MTVVHLLHNMYNIHKYNFIASITHPFDINGVGVIIYYVYCMCIMGLSTFGVVNQKTHRIK